MTYDFIIVGQGLSGSVASLSLMRSGYTVCVINNSSLSSCSSVAAGIWNPVVFKRLTKSWLADDVVPELNEFYGYAEKLFNVTLIRHRHIIKPIVEEQEKNLWLKKAKSDTVFLDPVIYNDLSISANSTIQSYSKVLNAGSLDVTLFLERTKNHLVNNNSYLDDTVDHSLLENHITHVSYKSVKAKNIIFCEGHLISANPYFNWIPMKPAKGEILTIYCEEIVLKNDILNKGLFILPVAPHTYKVGATYEWEHLNDLPTKKAKEELTQKLDAIINVPYKIIKHEAGVRPAVIDRRPVIGRHPTVENFFIFNGFGTKAVMLAPYFAKQFTGFLQAQVSINKEADPARFYKN